MKAVHSAQRAALTRQLRVSGEEVLIDGKAVMALVGSETAEPELGADGEPKPNVTVVVTIPADATSKKVISQGVPLYIRGREYGLESWDSTSPTFYQISAFQKR